MAKPSNSKLYNSIKSQAKSKFSVYPSAYASAWIVKQYKKRGGKYSGKKTIVATPLICGHKVVKGLVFRD